MYSETPAWCAAVHCELLGYSDAQGMRKGANGGNEGPSVTALFGDEVVPVPVGSGFLSVLIAISSTEIL